MALGNVHLTPQLVQAVRDAADIVSLASDHTRLRKAGRGYQGLCPIHKEKSPSFSVDPVKGLFYCFGCGAGGDAIKLHMLVTGDDFPAAIESLAGRYGIPLPSRAEVRPGGKPERDIEGALAAAADYFTAQLGKSAFARDYLARRRIPQELVERFELGYAPDGYQQLIPAMAKKVPLGDLEAAGLVARSERGDLYERFRHRLMFPIRNAAGRLVGFGGRTLGDDKAKYVNTSETDRFHKGFLLYGLHLAKREMRDSGRAILVEGYFDVIGAVAAGLEGAVGGMGTALTPEQARLLGRYAEEVVVAYDGDNAGESAFRRALPLLLGGGLTVRRAAFPGGHDPDSLRLAEGAEAVRTLVDAAPDAVGAELDRLIPAGANRDPRRQSTAAAAVAELLRAIPEAVLRYGYARLAGQRLGIPPELLTRRGAAPAGEPSPVPATVRRQLTRSLEESALELLLGGEGEKRLPPPAELPAAEVFFDPECRNIYQAFCALYAGTGAPPDLRNLRAKLDADEGAIARLAKIVLEEGEKELPPGRIGLLESLDRLVSRWQRLRDKEPAGDEELARRFEERKRKNLSRRPGGRRLA